MKRVLRNGLIGLLLCTALTPVVSMAMQKTEEIPATSPNKYTMSDYMGFGSLAYVVINHGPDALPLLKKVGTGIWTGLKKTASGIKFVAKKVKTVGWDVAIVPTYNYAAEHGKVTAATTLIGIGGRGVWHEVKKEKKESSGTSALLYGLSLFSGLGLLGNEYQWWEKSVGFKDSIVNLFSFKKSLSSKPEKN